MFKINVALTVEKLGGADSQSKNIILAVRPLRVVSSHLLYVVLDLTGHQRGCRGLPSLYATTKAITFCVQ